MARPSSGVRSREEAAGDRPILETWALRGVATRDGRPVPASFEPGDSIPRTPRVAYLRTAARVYRLGRHSSNCGGHGQGKAGASGTGSRRRASWMRSGIGTAEGGTAAAPTEEQRRPEERHLVEEPRRQERAEHLGAALDHQARDAVRRESREGRGHGHPAARARTTATSTPARSRSRRRDGLGAQHRARTGVRGGRSGRGGRGESRRRESSTTRRKGRRVRATAAAAGRRRAPCRSRRERRRGGAAATGPGVAGRALVIHFESPAAVAMRPSRVEAAFSRTNGRPRLAQERKRSFRRAASAARRPVSTATPARRRSARPRPSTSGLGSRSRGHDPGDSRVADERGAGRRARRGGRTARA